MLFCSNALLQLMGFSYRAALSRSASAEALGLNSLVMQIYRIITAVCISGLNVAVAAKAAKLPGEGIRPLMRRAFLLYFALFFSAGFPAALFSKTIGRTVLGDTGTYRILLIMLACIFMTGIENMLKSVHLGKKLVKRCAASELTEQAVRFTLVLLLLKNVIHGSGTDTVFIIMLGMLMSEFVSVTILSVSFFRSFPKGSTCRGVRLRELAGVAFPASLTALSSTFFSSLGELKLPDFLMRSGLSHAEALSAIGKINMVCMPLVSFPMAFIGAVASVIMPEISERASRGADPFPLIRRSALAAAAAGCVSTVVIVILGGRLAGAFFSRDVSQSLLLLLQLRAAVIFMLAVIVSAMNGLMLQRRVLVISAAGEAYQLALIGLLAPVTGIGGYAAASALGELIKLCACFICVREEEKKWCGNSSANMII